MHVIWFDLDIVIGTRPRGLDQSVAVLCLHDQALERKSRLVYLIGEGQ